jgi:hypothetical protein
MGLRSLLQKIIDNASTEQQKQHANNNLYHIHIRHFACCRRSILPPRPFALTDDKIVLGELGANSTRRYTPDTALRESRGLVIWNLLLACELRLPNWRSIMAIASYEVVGSGGVWRVKHDGEPVGSYQTKESAFEAAVAAASLAVREGYEVQLSVPGTRIES